LQFASYHSYFTVSGIKIIFKDGTSMRAGSERVLDKTIRVGNILDWADGRRGWQMRLSVASNAYIRPSGLEYREQQENR